MKKIMILGGGSCQVNAIKRVQAMGHQAIVTGYKKQSPGKKIADVSVLADTFDVEKTLHYARKLSVDGVLTSGTDQPVLTAATVSERLKLPSFLTPITALHVTNKKYMKEIFKTHNIPTVPFAVVTKNFDSKTLDQIQPPYVMKPLDSQGQRGIFVLDSIEDIRKNIDKTLKYSRCQAVLIEAYYENKEITVTGWVDQGKVNILTVTDRVTFNQQDKIGVCLSHEYPSIHLKNHREEIFHITHQICQAFQINEGPIYFQLLIGDEGIKVNEIACRIGGAYEDVSIPYITGVDILKMAIEGSITEDYKKCELRQYSYTDDHMCLSTQLFFCKSGKIKFITPIKQMKQLDCIIDIGYNFNVGDVIPPIENASQRAGYIIIKGSDEQEIQKNIEKVFNQLEILDHLGNNLVIKGRRGYRDET